jgi:thioesterase domain-containing protein
MASQLLRAGETVELIALLDAPAPRTPKQTGRLTRQRLGRLKEVLEDSKHKQSGPAERVIAITRSIGRKMVNALIWETTRHGRNLSVRARFALLHELLSRKAAWPRLVPELTAHQILNCAQARYVPKPIAVRTILARATSGEGIDTPYAQIYSDGTLGWKAVADNLIVIDVEGGHSSMLQEAFVDSLAQALLPYVRAKPIEVGTLDRARGDVNF